MGKILEFRKKDGTSIKKEVRKITLFTMETMGDMLHVTAEEYNFKGHFLKSYFYAHRFDLSILNYKPNRQKLRLL